jgi:hypothetical protein
MVRGASERARKPARAATQRSAQRRPRASSGPGLPSPSAGGGQCAGARLQSRGDKSSTHRVGERSLVSLPRGNISSSCCFFCRRRGRLCSVGVRRARDSRTGRIGGAQAARRTTKQQQAPPPLRIRLGPTPIAFTCSPAAGEQTIRREPRNSTISGCDSERAPHTLRAGHHQQHTTTSNGRHT